MVDTLVEWNSLVKCFVNYTISFCRSLYGEVHLLFCTIIFAILKRQKIILNIVVSYFDFVKQGYYKILKLYLSFFLREIEFNIRNIVT